MKKILYGIDFGTTNSALSIYDEERNEILTTILIPSLLYFPEEYATEGSTNHVVGETAISAYLEDGMKGRFIKSIKFFPEAALRKPEFKTSDIMPHSWLH